MKKSRVFFRILAVFLVFILAVPPCSIGQETGKATFTQEQLDQMLAPVALYPDSLLSQILMAATYPLEVVQAARWVDQNKNLKGDALAKSLEAQPWDPSVKSLVNFPQVLAMLNDKLDWTAKLGDAFLAQPKDVMNSVQKLRAKAEAQGTLKTTSQQKVTVEKETQTIIIEPASTEVIYVPAYNPTVVYGPWWYPAYPPYYYYPPGYYAAGAAFWFGAGVAVGAAWGYAWGSCNWHGGDIDIDIDRNININHNIDRDKYKNQMQGRGEGGKGTWQHNPQHRDGVAYRDQATSQRFGQSANRPTQTQRDARGYGSQGSDRGNLSSREGMQGRDVFSRDSMGGGDRSAFGGSGSGRSERMASQRGSYSRGSFGGGGGGFGGRSGGGRGRR